VTRRIWDLAGQGASFPKIAADTGITVHSIRRIVHGT
jgi:hypothetical protein